MDIKEHNIYKKLSKSAKNWVTLRDLNYKLFAKSLQIFCSQDFYFKKYYFIYQKIMMKNHQNHLRIKKNILFLT